MIVQDSSSSNFQAGTRIYVYDLDLDTETEIESGTHPDWNPVSDILAFETDLNDNRNNERRNTAIGLYDLQAGALTVINGGASFNHSLDWSPDGQSLVFLSDQDQSDNYQIWTLSLNQTATSPNQLPVDVADIHQLPTVGSRSPGHPTWTRDGNHITFDRFEPKDNIFARDIFSIPAGGGGETPLIVSQWNDFSPSWSPDGKQLAFISDRSGVAAIWVKDIQTEALSQLTGKAETHLDIIHDKLEWSPDGMHILFTGVHQDNSSSVFIAAVQ
jgi:TolB protein